MVLDADFPAGIEFFLEGYPVFFDPGTDQPGVHQPDAFFLEVADQLQEGICFQQHIGIADHQDLAPGYFGKPVDDPGLPLPFFK